MESNFKKTFIKYNLWFTLVASVLVLFLGSAFFVIPSYQESVTNRKSKNEAVRKNLDNREIKLASLKKLKQDYESISEVEKEKVGLVLPGEEELPELFLTLDTIAKESGFKLVSVSASENIAKKNEEEEGVDKRLGILDIGLELVGGNYNKLKMFLDKIERNVRLLDVKTVSFETNMEVINVMLSTYYYVEG